METSTLILTALGALLVLVAAFLVWKRRAPQVSAPDEPAQIPAAAQRPAAPTSVAGRFLAGLARSRDALARGLGRAFSGGKSDDGWLLTVEEALIASDVGVRASAEIAGALKDRLGDRTDARALRDALRQVLLDRLGPPAPLRVSDKAPTVILVVGVNGSGKTTTIGKLASRFKNDGKKVVLAAGDTFRAGAIEQLKVWGERAGVPVIAHQEGADPAAVIFDGVQAGLARGADVVICDTAGRLQAQKPLMDELGKVVRVIKKALPDAPHEVLLVLDATIGQNALSQARIFKEVVGVTGVALTKLDGTARGGVVLAVRQEMGLPVKLVGLGEKIEDLRDFDPAAFVEALVPDDLSATAG